MDLEEIEEQVKKQAKSKEGDAPKTALAQALIDAVANKTTTTTTKNNVK